MFHHASLRTHKGKFVKKSLDTVGPRGICLILIGQIRICYERREIRESIGIAKYGVQAMCARGISLILIG